MRHTNPFLPQATFVREVTNTVGLQSIPTGQDKQQSSREMGQEHSGKFTEDSQGEDTRCLGIMRGNVPGTKLSIHPCCSGMSDSQLMLGVGEVVALHFRVQLEHSLVPRDLMKTTEHCWPVVQLLSSHIRLQKACVGMCPAGTLVR